MLTVADVRVKSSLESIKALGDSQLQALIDAAHVILTAEGLNSKATGFSATFDKVHLMTFEWFASNPTMLKQLTQGGLTEAFSTSLPIPILKALKPILRGGFAEFSREGGV
jgi:hypothetical protein